MSRTQYVLIDFENVPSVSLEPLVKMSDVRIVMFVGACQPKIPTKIAEQLQKLGERATYEVLKVNGENTADLMIAFTAGQIFEKDPGAAVHVVSGDKGFCGWVVHLKKKKMLTYQAYDITQLRFLQPAKLPSESEFIASLQSMKDNPPRTRKSLTNHIVRLSRLPADDPKIPKYIDRLVRKGLIVENNNKLEYKFDK